MTERRNMKNLTAFWILGLCNNYGYVIMLSAAHDILHQNNKNDKVENDRDCNYISTGIILLADIIPSLMVKLVAPFFPLLIHRRMVLTVVFAALGLILVALSETTAMAICGVVLTSMSAGIGEISLLCYTVFFRDRNVINMWSSGTGGAGLFGSFSYLGLTYFGMTARMTILVHLVIPAVMAITFWVLLDNPFQTTDIVEIPSGDNVVATDVPTNILNLPFLDKMKFIPRAMQYMAPLTAVYFFEYFINQGLFELMYYPGIDFTHDEQYRWYSAFYQCGVFLSRSSLSFVQIDKLWILAILQGIIAMFFTVDSVYLFVSYIDITFSIIAMEGLLGGLAYVNTFYKISCRESVEKREIITSLTAISDSIGITLAGFTAIPVHNYICSLPKYGTVKM